MPWCMTCCIEICCGLIFQTFLYFDENLASVISDLGEKYDQQLEQLITEFADVPEEPQGRTSHRAHLDHKVKLTVYSHRRQRRLIHVID